MKGSLDMRNLSKQEIIDIAVEKFNRIRGRDACNENIKSTITKIVEMNEVSTKSE